jgi:hypothetical protein
VIIPENNYENLLFFYIQVEWFSFYHNEGSKLLSLLCKRCFLKTALLQWCWEFVSQLKLEIIPNLYLSEVHPGKFIFRDATTKLIICFYKFMKRGVRMKKSLLFNTIVVGQLKFDKKNKRSVKQCTISINFSPNESTYRQFN